MNDEILDKYSDIVVEVGLNIYEGQCLTISTQIESYEFALEISKKAYKKGAKYVEIRVSDPRGVRTKLENIVKDDFLEYVPDYIKAKNNEMLAYDWARLSIGTTERVDELNTQDPNKLQKIQKILGEAFKRSQEEYSSGAHQWSIVNVPGPRWAARVLNTEPTEENVKKLWDVLIPILRLDKPNPVDEWKKHCITLKNRCETLNNIKLDRIKFIGEGTDLELGLRENHKWAGGPFEKHDGSFFLPNIPTEEVFTTPDYKRTNGKVMVTRPVQVMGKVVEKAWFEFKDGKVINYGADKNKDILDTYLKVDDGASYLGEVALVDGHSEIFKSGELFHDILYDENASCHIAIGAGFPICFKNAKTMRSKEDKLRNGCNVSIVHTDFMIGSPGVDVIGYDGKGKEVIIMEKGEFKI